MSHLPDLKLLIILLIMTPALFHAAPARAQVVSGTITDAVAGTSLPDATVVLKQPNSTTVYRGSSTDAEGRYRISNIDPGRYVLTASYVGYREQDVELVLRDGTPRTIHFALEPAPASLDPVVVTAGPRPEKMLEAPSAVTVLGAAEMERDVAPSAVDVLRSTPGVDVARTGIDRREIVLRGFGKTFSGATYVMTDFRQSAIASLGVNAYSMMPISSIDLDRIEIVRGPAGAVYGPGVDAGVIHFVTKDPFRYPGTTIALTGGQQSLAQGELRHAGVVGGRFGYKITGQVLRAQDWSLDPSDPLDAEQLARYHQLVPRDQDVRKTTVTGTGSYRFGPSTSLTAVGGYASAQSVFLSDIGTLQSDGFGYRFGQLRLRAGRFFAQAYLNKNDAGDSFVYAGPQVASSLSGSTVVDRSTQLNVQAQYGLDLARGREQVTFGLDFERTDPATEGTINGSNENDDRVLEYGAYAQSRTRISDLWNLIVAARLDYDNIFEQLQLSPRAAVVYTPVAGHAVRATYNRAFASPGTNSLFLDIVAREPDRILPLRIRASGTRSGFTFAHESAFGAFGGSDLVASSLNPSTLGEPQPVGLPLGAVYDQVYAELERTPNSVLAEIARLPEPQVAALKQLLSPDAGTLVQGVSSGRLGLLNLTTGAVDPVSGAPDIAPLKQSTTQTVELGYKGLIGNRALISVDAYYTVKKNFVRGLQLETPFVFAPDLRVDLLSALQRGIENNQVLAAALEQQGIPPSALAGLIMHLADDRLPSPNTPVALVQPMENNAGAGQMPELMMTYRNFGRVAFYGLEAATQVELTDRASVHGALAYVSDDFFDHEELGEEDADLFVSLNAPTLRTGLGVYYRIPNGPSFSLGGRYTEEFAVRSGPYNGVVDDAFLLDVGAGYDFGRHVPGLRLDLTVQNLLDHQHREFIGAPKMGRLGLARFSYSF